MTVKEFVNKYKQIESSTISSNMIKEIISKRYIPVTIKTAYAKKIVEAANSHGSDSPGMYLLYIRSILQMYTTLELNNKNFSEDYDALQENGLVDLILNSIGNDLTEYQTVFNMCRDDYDKNNYTFEALIKKVLDSINNIGNQIINNPDINKLLEEYKKDLS